MRFFAWESIRLVEKPHCLLRRSVFRGPATGGDEKPDNPLPFCIVAPKSRQLLFCRLFQQTRIVGSFVSKCHGADETSAAHGMDVGFLIRLRLFRNADLRRDCHSRTTLSFPRRRESSLILRREEPAGFCHLQQKHQEAEPFMFHPTQSKIGSRFRGSDIFGGFGENRMTFDPLQNGAKTFACANE